MNEKRNWTDKLSHVITLAGTAILMNLMFLVAALPIVTIGPAWCGLMTSIRYNIRGDGWFAGFRKGFTTRFWRSLICWCLCLVVCLFFFVDFKLAVDTVQGTLYVSGTADTADPTGTEGETVEATVQPQPDANTGEDESLIEMGPTPANIANCVISGLFFAMAGMLTVSLLTLNVYIPTSVANWIRNGVNFFRYPLELLGAAALFWAPPLLLVFFPDWVGAGITIFIAAYFALAAVCGTMLLKDPLIDFLIDARADGTLTAEEGSQAAAQEEE